MENIHNFSSASSQENSRLWFIAALAVVFVSAQFLWAEIRQANFDIDDYSANIYTSSSRRDAVESSQIMQELNALTEEEGENDLFLIDSAIEAL